jgi:predicted RNA-binding protein associated with RNAse of E/G family
MSDMKIKVQKKDPSEKVQIEYEGDELHRDAHSITLEALFTREDMPFMDVTFKKGDRFVEYYYSDRWYNIFVIYDRDDGKLKGWYCNIGKPALIEAQVVSYVDLALDLWVSTNGQQTVLDEDEFEALDLTEELRQNALRGLDELKKLFLNNKHPT